MKSSERVAAPPEPTTELAWLRRRFPDDMQFTEFFREQADWHDIADLLHTHAADLQAKLSTLEQALRTLIEAADKVRHWHDTTVGRDEAFIVSAESVLNLWKVRDEARKLLSGESRQ